MVGSSPFHNNSAGYSLSAITVALLWFAVPNVGAQTSRAIPPHPSPFVLDQAGILTPQSESELMHKLDAALQDVGLEILVAIYDFVIQESLEDRAIALLDSRSEQSQTIALVMDCSANSMSLVGSAELQKTFTEFELELVFQRAAAQAQHHFESLPSLDAPIAQAELLHLTVDALLSDPALVESFRKRSPLAFSQSTFQLLISFTVGVTCLGIATFVWERRRGKRDRVRLRRGYFPATTVPFRLGADFSGGVSGTLEQ